MEERRVLHIRKMFTSYSTVIQINHLIFHETWDKAVCMYDSFLILLIGNINWERLAKI